MIKLSDEKYQIMNSRTEKGREKWYYQYLLTNDIAFKEIKVYNLNQYIQNKHKEIADKFIRQDKKILKKFTIIRIVIELLRNFAEMGIFFLIIYDAYVKKVLIGSAVAYLRCISNISHSIKQFMDQIVAIFNANLYINLVFEFLEMKSHEKSRGVVIEQIDSIKLINLSYRYSDTHEYVLENINLDINKGDCICIVGMNGSGKTTLVKILAGLYLNYEGEVLINGIELKSIDRKSLCSLIGILFQDFTKYEMTLRENIGMANLLYKDDDGYMKCVGANAHIHTRLLNQLDMRLGSWFEGGKQLSGGEWLRVGIARALARDAKIYILDEPSASLDVFCEESIVRSLKTIIEDKIGVIITHRMSNICILQGNIVVLDKGKIVGFGSHEYLYKECELYSSLCKSDEKYMV